MVEALKTQDPDLKVEAYQRVFERAVPDSVLSTLRMMTKKTLGGREPLQDGQRDQKWWVSLLDLYKAGSTDAVKTIIAEMARTDGVRAAMEAVGDDPVAIMHYCILRRFDPNRNPVPAQWHFDANILGLNNQVINTWIPLVDVGETAPGITLVVGARRPRRLWEAMVELVDEDGNIPRAAKARTLFPDEVVEREVAADPDAAYLTPVVPAGGAIAFDHQILHTTQRLGADASPRESFEFRVMSERVARAAGIIEKHPLARLY
jgi:hypothetical protein